MQALQRQKVWKISYKSLPLHLTLHFNIDNKITMRREVIEENGEPVIEDFIDEVDESVLNRYKRHRQEWLLDELP